MKMKKQNIIGMFVVFAAIFASCTKTDFNPISSDKLMGDTLMPATTTMAQLIATYKSDSDLYSDIKLSTKTTLVKNAGLFTVCQMKSATDLILRGVIISSDVEGNIYKYIVIQETAPGGMAFKISIDAGSLSGIYPIGQEVTVKCNDLYLGRYAQAYQIGTYSVNLDKVVVDTLHKVNVYRIEPGRIPLPVTMNIIKTYGLPKDAAAKADTMTIAQIKNAGPSVINKLVCIKNAYFTGRGADYNLPIMIKDADMIFAPPTNGIGYPQSREIQDGTGNIFVSTSEYSKFATYNLPSSTSRGNLTAIVGWYNDKKPAVFPTSITTEIYHQLTIRGLFDLGKGFESFHNQINK
jgi:hypothetical protein